MKKCIKCGTANPDTAKFCKKCRASFDVPIEGEVVDYNTSLLKDTKKNKRFDASDVLETLGGILLMILYIAFFVFIIFALVKGATFLSETLLPILFNLVWPLFFITLFILAPLSIIKKLRGAMSVAIFISSYVYGLTAWLIGFIVTLFYWGILGVIIGLFLGGVGVVPVGAVAGLLNKNWNAFWDIVILAVMVYGTRVFSMWLAEHSDS